MLECILCGVMLGRGNVGGYIASHSGEAFSCILFSGFGAPRGREERRKRTGAWIFEFWPVIVAW
jgi:hypothetical protein